MPLLADYAITPDVFDKVSYPTVGECEARIETIREAMLTEGVVRDLRNGHWRTLFGSDGRPWHQRGTELVKKLAKQGRLVGLDSELPDLPANDVDWCSEALATHSTQPFTGGIIVTKAVKREHAREPLVAPIDRLRNVRWWKARSPSVRLARKRADYEEQLDLVLRCSKSLMFIDPYLDPTRRGYRSFGALLQRAQGRASAPLIEIHRRVPTDQDTTKLERQFRSALAVPMRTAHIDARVFLWAATARSRFHDRYLISDLVGISIPDGFDTGRGRTTWTRLGRDQRDDIQREFDPASSPHRLVSNFRIL